MSKVMTQPMFSGDLSFLSNFHMKEFYLPQLGKVKSGEHSFNAFKSTDAEERKWVLEANTPAEAKKRGRKVTLRPGWDDTLRFKAMQITLNHKFKDPELAELLLATGATPLVETNYWHDQIWGDCYCAKHANVAGKNVLGNYLMVIRTNLAIKRSNG